MKRALLLLALGLLGCNETASTAPPSSGGKLIIAKVDTLPILQRDPAYEKYSQEYMTANIKLQQDLKQKLKEGTITEQEALKSEVKFNEKWMKATNDFIQGNHGKMREVVGALCKEKGIDLVLIDSKAYRTVAWGGFDITQDVLMKIYGNSTGPATEGTPK